MSRTISKVVQAVCLATCLGLVPQLQAAQWKDLTGLAPAGANAIVLIDATQLWDSPIGKREKWREQAAQRHRAAPFALPPSTQRCVLAAELDFSTLRPDWEAALLTLSADVAMADVAQRHGGVLDTVASKEAAWIAKQTCVVKFAPQLFGLLAGGSRQDAVRWVKNAAAAPPANLSPYLSAVAESASGSGAVELAIDLTGAFRPEDVRGALTASGILDGASQQQAVAVLSTVTGVRLSVAAGESLQGRLQLDTGADTAALAPSAKQLMVGLLAKSGAMLDEFESWNATATGSSLVLEGPLSLDGLRRLLSLITVSPAELGGEPAASAATAPVAPPLAKPDAQQQRVANATRRYFAGISRYIDDLGRLNRARSVDQAALWLENYARGINSLSKQSVDPEVVEYGNYVVQTLQSIVDQAYGVAEKAAEATGPPQPTGYRVGLLPTGRTVNYGGYRTREYVPYGFMDFPSPQADRERRQRTADEIYEATKQARATLDQLIADHATVQSKLTQRYGAGF